MPLYNPPSSLTHNFRFFSFTHFIKFSKCAKCKLMKCYRIHDHKVFFNRLFHPHPHSFSSISILCETQKLIFFFSYKIHLSVHVQAKIMFNYCNFAHSLRFNWFSFYSSFILNIISIQYRMWELNDTYSWGDFGDCSFQFYGRLSFDELLIDFNKLQVEDWIFLTIYFLNFY